MGALGAIGIGVLIIIIGLMLGAYIQYAFMAATLFLVYALEYKTSFLLTYSYGVLNSLVLLCVPLFIAVGLLMNESGIGKRIVDFVDIFVGRLKAGLAIVAVVASAGFGSIAGSSLATLSCIGSITQPRFEEAGYNRGFYTALITCAAPLGLLIPPSAHMILYSYSTRQSLLACFLATVGPGLTLVVLLSITSYFMVRNDKNIKTRERMTTPEFLEMTKKRTFSALPALIMPVIVLGGIYGGIFTPTEAAAVAVIYSIPVGFFIYKELTWEKFSRALIETASTTGVVMVMIFCIMMLSRIYIMEDLPGIMTEAIRRFSDDRSLVLLGTNLILIVVGMIMDDTSAILLCSPLFAPILMDFGVDPIHFAAIIGVNIGIGLLSPPTAPCLYFGAGVLKTDVVVMLPYTLKFLFFAWVPTLVVTTYVPELSLWLPRFILG